LDFLTLGILQPVRPILTAGALLSLLRFRTQRLFGVLLIVATVIVVPLIITIQRVVPPDRVWLFLIPLYLGAASAGLVFSLDVISSLLRRLKRASTKRARPATWAVPTLALIAISWHAWSQQAGVSYFRPELPQADQVASYLKQVLRPNDSVLAAFPCDVPLEYYFQYFSVSSKHLIADPDWSFNAYTARLSEFRLDRQQSERILTIVNPVYNQSLESAFRFLGEAEPARWSVKPVSTFGPSTIYELRLVGPDPGVGNTTRDAPEKR
jgi:hypothetical protein